MSSQFFNDLSKLTDDREMITKQGSKGKLFRTQGSRVWMSTEAAAMKAFLTQQNNNLQTSSK